jgi:prolyl-tRNA editing enzyme YbaK/EbsC (Cys-tRNA(Pro) deacylase)
MAACKDAAIAMGLQTGGVAGPGCARRVPIAIDSILVTRRDSTALMRERYLRRPSFSINDR